MFIMSADVGKIRILFHNEGVVTDLGEMRHFSSPNHVYSFATFCPSQPFDRGDSPPGRRWNRIPQLVGRHGNTSISQSSHGSQCDSSGMKGRFCAPGSFRSQLLSPPVRSWAFFVCLFGFCFESGTCHLRPLPPRVVVWATNTAVVIFTLIHTIKPFLTWTKKIKELYVFLVFFPSRGFILPTWTAINTLTLQRQLSYFPFMVMPFEEDILITPLSSRFMWPFTFRHSSWLTGRPHHSETAVVGRKSLKTGSWQLHVDTFDPKFTVIVFTARYMCQLGPESACAEGCVSCHLLYIPSKMFRRWGHLLVLTTKVCLRVQTRLRIELGLGKG